MRIAQVVSIVTHPLLLTTYLVWLLGRFAPQVLMVQFDFHTVLTVLIFIMTFALPMLNLFMFKRLGLIATLGMETRRERLAPFVFIAVLYIVVVGLFYKVNVSSSMTKLMIIVAALALLSSVYTFFFKVSVHSLSWAGLIGILLPLNRLTGGALAIPIMIVIPLAGLVMSARLQLNAHSPREVWTGFISGFIVGFAGMVVLF